MHAHTFEGPAPVTSLLSSSRKRIVAAGYADGSIRAFYVTSERQIAEYPAPAERRGDPGVKEIFISPKDDLVGVITGNDLRLFKFDPAYPEASLKGLFLKFRKREARFLNINGNPPGARIILSRSMG
jgi:ABC-type uncharacterized transport system permease subunit